MMRRVCFLFLLVLFAGSCTNMTDPIQVEEEPFLRIGYHTESQFEHRYAEWLAVDMPELRYEIVPLNKVITRQMSVEQWHADNETDLVYIPGHWFPEFVRHNLLIDLQPLLEADSDPPGPLVPAVMQLTRLHGNGDVYGLPPNFHSRALLFDKDWFDREQVAYPTDLMTWEEVVMLAARFDKGLSLPYPTLAHWIWDMGTAMKDGDFLDGKGKPALDTPEWDRFFALVEQPLRQGNMTFDDINDQVLLDGEHAMALITYDDYLYLEAHFNERNWELVTAPVHPANPEHNHHLTVNGYFAIPAGSQNRELAWALIKRFLSEDAAKWEHRKPYGFSAVAPDLFTPDADRIGAFYKMGVSKVRETFSEQVFADIEQYIGERFGEND